MAAPAAVPAPQERRSVRRGPQLVGDNIGPVVLAPHPVAVPSRQGCRPLTDDLNNDSGGTR